MKNVKLAICGRSCCGKTTLINYLIAVYRGVHLNVVEDESFWDRLKARIFQKSSFKRLAQVVSSAEANVFVEGVESLSCVKALQKAGVKVIWIDRNTSDRLIAGADDRFNRKHPLDDYANFDAVLINNGSLKDLYFAMNRVIKKLGAK